MRFVIMAVAAALLFVVPVPWVLCADGEPAAERTMEFARILVRHRPAQDLMPMLSDLVSEGGTLVADAATNSVVVNDFPEVIREIEARLAKLDVAPDGESLQLKMQIVLASNKKDDGEHSEALKALLPTLQEVLAFSSYEIVSEAAATVRERSAFRAERSDEFAWSFTPFLEAVGLPLRLETFSVSVATQDGRFTMETDLRLPLGRPVVLGCTSLDSAERAVIVVLTASKVK